MRAHIKDRKGRPKRWQVCWEDPDTHKERTKSYALKDEAEEFLDEIRNSIRSGSYVDLTNTTTVAEYARAWVAGQPHRRTTARRVEGLIRNTLEGTPLGNARLITAASRPSMVQAWVTGLGRPQAEGGRGLSARTLRVNHVAMLKTVFNAAVADRLIPASPFQRGRLALPVQERKEVVPLTVAQVRQLAEAAPPQARAMVLTQAALGLRAGELCGLRVQDVDWLAREPMVRIEEQIDLDFGGRAPLKTPGSRRTLPAPDSLIAILREHAARFPPLPDGTLFYGVRTGRSYRSGYHTIIMGSVRRAVAADPTFPSDTSSHSLRHHYAGELIRGGATPHEVAAMLGHTDVKLVWSTYGHLFPDSESRVRKIINSVWSERFGSETEGREGFLRGPAGGPNEDHESLTCDDGAQCGYGLNTWLPEIMRSAGLPARRGAGAVAGAQRGRCAGPARRGPGRGPDRQPALDSSTPTSGTCTPRRPAARRWARRAE